MFAGSSLTMQYSIKYGNKNLTALGSIITCIYPLLLAYSYNNYLYYICSFLGGAAWAFINVGLMNYLLEKIPSDDMPAYMAWYNIVLNAGILLGSLGGAWIGS
jgi:MFS family permease